MVSVPFCSTVTRGPPRARMIGRLAPGPTEALPMDGETRKALVGLLEKLRRQEPGESGASVAELATALQDLLGDDLHD